MRLPSALSLAALMALPLGLPVRAQGADLAPLYQRLSALAPRGDAEVLYNLGMFLNNGLGVARDNRAAFAYFSQAAEAGHALAAYKVGCYHAGQFPGVVPVNEAEALRYKRVAAEAGYSLAQYDLGAMLVRRGERAQGLVWLEQASHQGQQQAQLTLAYLHSSQPDGDRVQALALMRLLRASLDKPHEAFMSRLNSLQAELSEAQLAQAEQLRAGWVTGPTPLTLQAQAGVRAVPALLEQLER
jgi:TPR repeat protein